MTGKPSVSEVRARVRTRPTGDLLMLAGSLQDVRLTGSPPKAAVRRFEAMREEVFAELERRGIAPAPDFGLTAVVEWCGNAAAVKRGGD